MGHSDPYEFFRDLFSSKARELPRALAEACSVSHPALIRWGFSFVRPARVRSWRVQVLREKKEKKREKGVRSCKPAFERLVDPMAHEASREVSECLRVLETCWHPGRHRVPAHGRDVRRPGVLDAGNRADLDQPLHTRAPPQPGARRRTAPPGSAPGLVPGLVTPGPTAGHPSSTPNAVSG